VNTNSPSSAEAFEARYRHGRDPWSFAQSPYELNRYRIIMSCLHRASYELIYEPGCGVGVLTQQLAGIANTLIAADFAPSALDQARTRCAHRPNIEFICADLRTFMPSVAPDLIIFSELGYYFSLQEIECIAADLGRHLRSGGEFIAGHWLGNSKDHVLHANQVHEVLRSYLGLSPRRQQLHAGFRLDSWTK